MIKTTTNAGRLPYADRYPNERSLVVAPLQCGPTTGEVPYQTVFNDLICADIRQRQAQVVVDVGAGGGLIVWLQQIRELAPQLVGIDPGFEVTMHKDLDRAIHSTMEDADLGDLRADVAYAFNVIEHISTPERFLRKIHAMLRPGASFWYLTTNEAHPFCIAAHLVRFSGIKGWYRQLLRQGDEYGINDYPSYYRLNRVGRVARYARRCGFSRFEYARFCSGWESYFPKPLRALPLAYDAIVQRHVEAGRLILVCRLVR